SRDDRATSPRRPRATRGPPLRLPPLGELRRRAADHWERDDRSPPPRSAREHRRRRARLARQAAQLAIYGAQRRRSLDASQPPRAASAKDRQSGAALTLGGSPERPELLRTSASADPGGDRAIAGAVC